MPPLFLVLVLMGFGLVMSGGIAAIVCAASNKRLSPIARAHLNTLISAGLSGGGMALLPIVFIDFIGDPILTWKMFSSAMIAVLLVAAAIRWIESTRAAQRPPMLLTVSVFIGLVALVPNVVVAGEAYLYMFAVYNHLIFGVLNFAFLAYAIMDQEAS